jgi:hypothetical protein
MICEVRNTMHSNSMTNQKEFFSQKHLYLRVILSTFLNKDVYAEASEYVFLLVLFN